MDVVEMVFASYNTTFKGLMKMNYKHIPFAPPPGDTTLMV